MCSAPEKPDGVCMNRVLNPSASTDASSSASAGDARPHGAEPHADGADANARGNSAPLLGDSTHGSGPAGPPPRPVASNELSGDPSRTGTMWLGVTGVAMLLAAAGVLTAVSWGDIGQTAKLGGLVAITIGMLVGGRRLQPLIPLSGRAIFHLGALLIPFDMAAVAILAERSWQQSLLLTSGAAVISWAAVFRLDPSPVMRWAALSSVPMLAAGIAAVTPIAMPLALAPAALVAAALWWTSAEARSDGSSALFDGAAPKEPTLTALTLQAATLWAIVTGLATMGLFGSLPTHLVDVLGEIGIVVSDRWQLVAAVVVATVTSGVLAAKRPDMARGWMTVSLATIAGVVATTSVDVQGAGLVIAAGLFVFAELVLVSVRNDPDWSEISTVFGILVEVMAGMALVIAAAVGLFVQSPVVVAGAILLGLGFLVADGRRVLDPNDWLVGLVYGSGWLPATLAVPTAAAVAVLAGGGGQIGVPIAFLASGLWVVVSGRPYNAWVVGALTLGALWVSESGWVGVAVSLASLSLLTGAARHHQRTGRTDEAVVLAVMSIYSGVAFAEQLQETLSSRWDPLVMVIGIAALWLPSIAISSRFVSATWVGRAMAVLLTPFIWGSGLWIEPGRFTELPTTTLHNGVAACATVLALSIFDWNRHRHVVFEATAALSVVLGTFSTLALLSVRPGQAALIVTGLGLVAVGLMLVLKASVERPLALLALFATIVGVGLAGFYSEHAIGAALLLAGASIAMFGVANRSNVFIAAAGLVTVSGLWIQLAVLEVTWLEAYLGAPALVAVWAGWYWHRAYGHSTWITLAPTFTIYGGLAIIDRMLGGSAWHSVIAGGVAVAGVLIGALFRFVGPLVSGTVLLAVVVTYEVVATGAQVPTWGWLAAGGVLLLGTAVAMERAETTPLEQGQRLARVLSTRFG